MARYVVLEHENLEDTIFIKDGFKAFAFLFPVLWFVFHKMWREALLALLISVAVSAVAGFAGFGQMSTFLVLLLQFAIGLEAQNLRISRYIRQGFRRRAAIFASSVNEVEIRYFHAIALSHDKPVAASHRRGSLVPILGLFA